MTLVSVTAYHSFGGEVEALNTPTIRRLTPSCRHQLPHIAPLVTTAVPQKIDITRFKRTLGGRLRGLDYIGMIEPSYYNNAYDLNGTKTKAIISWHCHFLVWGVRHDELRKYVKRINSELCAEVGDGMKG